MNFISSKRYNKQYVRCFNRGKNLDLLDRVLELLKNNQQKELQDRHKDHQLKGELKNYRDCHVKPDGKKTDWVLVYERLENGDIKLIATGDHKDVFTETGRNLRSEFTHKRSDKLYVSNEI